MNDPWAGFLISSAAWQGVPHSRAIANVRAAGFGGVEILCKPGHFECANEDHIREVESALDDWPEAVVTFHAPFYDLDLASSDCDAGNHALRATDVALRLRAETITVHTRRISEMGHWDEDAFNAFRRNLSLLAACNLTIAVENLPPPAFTSHEDDILALLDGYPDVGACIDTGHAHLGGRTVEVAQALAERAFIAHIHDNRMTGDNHLMPGRGTIPWKEVVEALRGFRGRLVIETVRIESLDDLKKAIKETGLWELA